MPVTEEEEGRKREGDRTLSSRRSPESITRNSEQPRVSTFRGPTVVGIRPWHLRR